MADTVKHTLKVPSMEIAMDKAKQKAGKAGGAKRARCNERHRRSVTLVIGVAVSLS